MALRDTSTTSQNDSVLEDIIAGIFTDNSQTQQQFLSIIGLLYQAGINIAVGAGAFLVFVALRPTNARVYARRYKALSNDEKRPPRIASGILSWVPVLWHADEQFLLDTVGIDSVFFLRFLKLGIWLMGIYGLLGMLVVVPVNYSYGNNKNVTGDLKEFALLWITLYHITTLNVFWLHVIAAYVITGIFFYFVWREYRRFIHVRQTDFASAAYQRKLQSRTLMVTRVPADTQSDRALHSFMAARSNSAAVVHASIARKLGELQDLINSHEQAVRRLERVLSRFLAGDYTKKPRPQIKINGVPVDAIEHYTREIAGLEHAIGLARQQTDTFTPTSVGFVSYATPQTAHDAMRTMARPNPAAVVLAPHPKDVIWSNAQMPRGRRVRRLWTARLISIVFCFVAFWPVAALTFIGDSTNIRVIWRQSADFFNKHSTLTTIWQTTFSPLILTLYYIAMPHVFRAISRYQGISTHTGVERSVLKKMYVFYLLSNILVFTLVGVIVRAVLKQQSFKQSLSDLAHDFVESLNLKAQFWTAYVSLKGLSALLELAQLISLAMIFLKRYTRDLTPRELRDLTRPPEFDYAPVYSLYLWVFTISMFYALYSPIALPFAFLNFLLAYWVYKYAVMYVYTTKHDTGGAMWRCVINRMISSMIVFQVYLICCLKVRIDEFTDRQSEMRLAQPIVYVLIPLPVITLVAGMLLVWRWANPKVNYMINSTESAGCFDAGKAAIEDASAGATLGDRFLHPIISQPLATPMVDKRVRHLLPKVYRGRTSMLATSSMDGANTYKQVDSKHAYGGAVGSASFANASTVFGSDAVDLESVMDERDRRDFDGATTPLPGAAARGAGRIMPAMNHSVKEDVMSPSYAGESVEMRHLGNNLSSSRANLLGHPQHAPAASSYPPSDASDHEESDMLMLASLSSSSVNRGGNNSNQHIRYAPPHSRTVPRWD